MAEEEASYTIDIDRDICMGSGVCVVYAPKTFDVDEETKAVVKDIAGDRLDEIEAAVAGCPTGAITLTRSPPLGLTQ